jgi:hypothetical protein
MILEQYIQQFTAQPNEFGQRVQKALEYREALHRGEINPGEYEELTMDLTRLDNIQLSSWELERQIAFDQCIKAIMALPLP